MRMLGLVATDIISTNSSLLSHIMCACLVALYIWSGCLIEEAQRIREDLRSTRREDSDFGTAVPSVVRSGTLRWPCDREALR